MKSSLVDLTKFSPEYIKLTSEEIIDDLLRKCKNPTEAKKLRQLKVFVMTSYAQYSEIKAENCALQTENRLLDLANYRPHSILSISGSGVCL